MSELLKRRSKRIGLPPGTLIHVGEKKTERVRITVMNYDKDQFEEKQIKTVEECFPLKDKPTVTWINIDGVHETEVIKKIGKHFDLHPLTLEDIVDTRQRPKIEDFEDYLLMVLKMLYHDERQDDIRAEQMSVILGSNFVISFQEREGDVFNPVRERIRTGKGRIRKMGADYLAYALIDTIVDNYFMIPEKLGEKIESMEEELVTNPTPETLQTIHNLKRKLIFLRKLIWPLREIVSGLQRTESTLIHESTDIYLRDVYDHTVQVIDTIETSRDILSGMLDIYLSSISNRMNQIMKVLTIIATIFMPLTFIAGIYGMNFRYMPELEWYWAYPLILGTMIVIGILMLVYFKKKKWL